MVKVRIGLLAAAVSSCAATVVLLAAPASAAQEPRVSAPVITSSPSPNPGNDTTPTWSFTYLGEDDRKPATVSCTLTGPGRPEQWVNCTSPISYDLTGHPDGTYTFMVRHLSADGKPLKDFSTSDTYVLDTLAPVTITSSPASPSDASSGSWSFTAEAGATFQCKLSQGGSDPPFSPCSSGDTFAFPTDGTYTFTVQATDPLGNTGPPATDTHVRETAAPPPPGTPIITSPLARIGQNTSSAWTFTAESGASTFCQVSPSGPNPSGFVPCTSPAAYNLVTDGIYTFSVYATNASGTSATSTDTYTRDTSAPTAPVIGSGPVSPGIDPTPQWTFTAEDGSNSECMLASETAVIATWTPCSGSQSYRLSDAGSYIFSVRSRDAAGNTSPTSTVTYVFQPAEPNAGPVGPPPAPPGDPTPPGNPSPGNPHSDVTPPAAPQSEPAPAPSPAPSPSPDPSTPTPTPAPQPSAPPAETFTREARVDLSTEPAVTPGPLTATGVASATTSTADEGPATPRLGLSSPGASDEFAAAPAVLPSPGEDTIAETILSVGVETVKKTAFPFFLLLILFLFLLVQDRIDRRDPKLAMAPVYRDAALSFEPPPTKSPPRHD